MARWFLLVALACVTSAGVTMVTASCCGTIPPPEFRLGAPPKPPILLREPPACEAFKEFNTESSNAPSGSATFSSSGLFPRTETVTEVNSPGYSTDAWTKVGSDLPGHVEDPQHTGSDLPSQAPPLYGGDQSQDQYNLSVHQYQPGVAPTSNPTPSNGPSNVPSTDGKKPVAVGMIVGIVIAFLALAFVALVAWFVAKKKNLKYQVEPESSDEKPHNFLYNYKIRGWFWRRSQGGDGRRNRGADGRRKRGADQGSLSSTSSESGYCEDVGGDNTAAATPDIIASTQPPDEETPKRWSLFGLLPSLKPVLVDRGLDGNSSVCDADDRRSPDTDEDDATPLGGIRSLLAAPATWVMERIAGRRGPPPAQGGQIPLKAVSNATPQAGTRPPVGAERQASVEDDDSVPLRKARIRIRQNYDRDDGEVNV